MIPSNPESRKFPSSGTHPISPPFSLLVHLPRPFRFLGVGGIGLITDLCIFTALLPHGIDPLGARIISLAAATLVTWRLNRSLTFDRSHRHQGEEAARYTMVTIIAQGTSYAVFALLVLTVLSWLPQAALLTGAGFGAVIGYCGHRFFAFAPKLTRRHKASGQ